MFGHLKVLSRKKYDIEIVCCLELVPLMGEKISSHTNKADSWYLFGVLLKIFDKPTPSPPLSPVFYFMEVLPGTNRACSI